MRAQGLGSAESAAVLLYIKHFGLCRKRSDRKKETAKFLDFCRNTAILTNLYLMLTIPNKLDNMSPQNK